MDVFLPIFHTVVLVAIVGLQVMNSIYARQTNRARGEHLAALGRRVDILQEVVATYREALGHLTEVSRRQQAKLEEIEKRQPS